MIGLLRAMAALQSWSGAGLLGMIRALIRDDDPPYLGRPRHGNLPDAWDDSLVHEIALALAVSAPSAARTTQAAWELGARLPGVELLLRDGTLDLPRARLITEVFGELSDENCRQGGGAAAAGADDPAAQDLHPDRADRHRDRGGGRPGAGRAAAEGGGEAPVAGGDVPRAVRRGRAIGPRPAGRRDPGRLRQPRRPRPAVQGLRGVPGRADRPPAGDGLPGHPQRHLRRRPHRLRSPQL